MSLSRKYIDQLNSKENLAFLKGFKKLEAKRELIAGLILASVIAFLVFVLLYNLHSLPNYQLLIITLLIIALVILTAATSGSFLFPLIIKFQKKELDPSREIAFFKLTYELQKQLDQYLNETAINTFDLVSKVSNENQRIGLINALLSDHDLIEEARKFIEISSYSYFRYFELKEAKFQGFKEELKGIKPPQIGESNITTKEENIYSQKEDGEINFDVKPKEPNDLIESQLEESSALIDQQKTKPVRPHKTKEQYLLESEHRIKVGLAGELFALKYERARLVDEEGESFLSLLEHSSIIQGDGLGYDIVSSKSGEKIYIEVKTTTGKFWDNLIFTANEFDKMNEFGHQYCIYRVYEFDEGQGKGKIARFYGMETILETFDFMPRDYRFKLK